MVRWHPGRDFVVAPFIGRKIGEDQKKKKSLRCNTSWLSVQKYVMTRRKRSLTTNQWVFGLKRKQKRNKMLSLGADHQPRPSCDATILNKFVFGNHIFSFVKRMNIQFLVFTAGAQLGFCSGGWGNLNPKVNLFLKMSHLGAVLSKGV